MAKLNREALAHYLDTGMHPKYYSSGTTAVTPAWEIIGEDIEEMSVDLNPNTDQFKNILGNTKTKDDGYEPSMSADPFYADPDSTLYTKVRDIALGRKKGADCKTIMLEVVVEDSSATNFLAYVQEVMIKPQSYGGDTAGLNFPFNVLEDGNRYKGYVTKTSVTAGSPVFTVGDIPT